MTTVRREEENTCKSGVCEGVVFILQMPFESTKHQIIKKREAQTKALPLGGKHSVLSSSSHSFLASSSLTAPLPSAGAGGGRRRPHAWFCSPSNRLWLSSGPWSLLDRIKEQLGQNVPWADAREKPGGAAGTDSVTPSPACQTNSLQKPGLEEQASKVERELWDRATSVTWLPCVSQADPKALTLTWALQQAHSHRGPASCKAHGSRASHRATKSSSASPNPARTPAVQRCSGLGFAGCKREHF